MGLILVGWKVDLAQDAWRVESSAGKAMLPEVFGMNERELIPQLTVGTGMV